MTAMEQVISEIVLRATSKVLGPTAHPSRVEAVAAPLSEALIDLVVAEGNTTSPAPVIDIGNYLVFELWNRILDEVEKEIPIAAKIEVVTKNIVKRSDRRFVNNEDWRTAQLTKPMPTKKL